MRNIQLSFGDWHLTVTAQALTLAHQRKSGQHLQVYFSANPSRRWRGRWTPHITNPRTRGRTWLSRAPFSEVVTTVKNLERDVLARYASCLRRVDVKQLVDEGWVTMLIPPERGLAFLDDRAKVAARHYRISEQLVEDLGSLGLEHITPVDEVLLLPGDKRCAHIFRVDDAGNVERAQLQFLPRSPHDDDGGGPGWFLLPWAWLDDEAFAGILAAHVRPGFFKAVRILSTVLDLPLDHDRIAQVEALAMRKPSNRRE